MILENSVPPLRYGQPMSDGAGVEVFDTQLDAWRAWQQTPWGRIRYRVVTETLRRTCSTSAPDRCACSMSGAPTAVTHVPLAEAGHDVTVLDYSAPLLDGPG